MADLRLLSREFLTEFISVYKDNPCLWKVKSKQYSDKHQKNAAYEVLIEKLKEVDPTANRDAVIKRINSLRTCFRKELKKTRNWHSGMDEEDVYKPNLWYFDMLMFLTDQETPREDGMDNIQDSSVVDDASISSEQENIMQSSTTETELSSRTATPSTSSSTSIKKYKRKIDKSDEVLSIVADKLQNQGKYAAFGQHMAQELQELPSEMAIYCKRVLNEAIFQAQLGKLNQTSRIVTDSTIASRSIEQPVFHYDSQGSTLPPEIPQISTAPACTQESGRLGDFYSQYSYQQ